LSDLGSLIFESLLIGDLGIGGLIPVIGHSGDWGSVCRRRAVHGSGAITDPSNPK
jgi:hypothetical protein